MDKRARIHRFLVVEDEMMVLLMIEDILDSRTKRNAVQRLTEKLVWCLEPQSLSRAIIQ